MRHFLSEDKWHAWMDCGNDGVFASRGKLSDGRQTKCCLGLRRTTDICDGPTD